MIGIHCFKPNFKRLQYSNGETPKSPSSDLFALEDFDVIVQYLSILSWKRYNGDIHLYTTSDGKRILDELNVASLYDYINTDVLDNADDNYNVSAFWTTCKLQIQKHLPLPYCMLDLDLYVEKNLKEVGFFDKSLGLLHKELFAVSYPHPKCIPGYNIEEDWKWQAYPVNVALLYMNNEEIRTEYIDKALSFIFNSPKEKLTMDYFCAARICMAEQRLFGEIVDNRKPSYNLLIKGLYLPQSWSSNTIGFNDVQNLNPAFFKEDLNMNGDHFKSNIKEVAQWLNHLWGFKNNLIQDRQLKMVFVLRLLLKVKRDYPDFHERILNSIDYMYKRCNEEYAKA